MIGPDQTSRRAVRDFRPIDPTNENSIAPHRGYRGSTAYRFEVPFLAKATITQQSATVVGLSGCPSQRKMKRGAVGAAN